jgi:hypothetical protein
VFGSQTAFHASFAAAVRTHTTAHPYRIVCAHIPRSRRYCTSPPPDDIIAITLAWSQHDAIKSSASSALRQPNTNRAHNPTRHARPTIKTPRLHKKLLPEYSDKVSISPFRTKDLETTPSHQ